MRRERVAGGVVAVLIAGIGCYYAVLAWSMHRTDVFHRTNLVFDMDSNLMPEMLGLGWPNGAWDADKVTFQVKHPFIRGTGLILDPLSFLVGSRNVAASILFVAAGLITLLLIDRVLVELEVDWIDRSLLVLLFGFASIPSVMFSLPESYGLSLAGVAWLLWLAVRRERGKGEHLFGRYANALYLFSVTLTNAAQVVIVESFVGLARHGARRVVADMLRFGCVCGLVISVLFVAIYFRELPAILADPLMSLKRAYWAGDLGDDPELPDATPLDMLPAFTVFPFVAPDPVDVPIGRDAPMQDFRAFSYSTLGWVGVVTWVPLLLAGVVVGAVDRKLRTLALIGGVVFLVNFVLHLTYQTRGTVYLFSTHFVPWIFLFVAFAASHFRGSRHHAVFRVVLGVCAAAIVVNNVLVLTSLIDRIPVGVYSS